MPAQQRRGRPEPGRSFYSRSTRAFGITLCSGLFLFGQYVLASVDSPGGVSDTLFGVCIFASLTWFIWRCAVSPGIYLSETTLRVEQIFCSWVLSRDRIREVSASRGLDLVTPLRTIGVFGLSGSLLADWSGNTSVRRAARAVKAWAEAAVIGPAGVERVNFRRALFELLWSLLLWSVGSAVGRAVM